LLPTVEKGVILMSRLVCVTALLGVFVTAACGGATTRDSGAPVYTPPTSSSRPGDIPPSSTPTQVNPSSRGEIPAGQELDVRLQTTLSSATAQPEQRFDATTVADLTQDGRVLVPAGSTVRGVVANVDKADRIDRAGKLTLSFDRLTVRGRNYPIRGMATQVFESGGIREEGTKAGAGAGVGAVIGGIIGGVKGAVIGAVIGAGGTIAATEGKDIELPAGSIVRIRIDSPVDVR
jgi:hypothetical protein